jgi:hypothetical protein
MASAPKNQQRRQRAPLRLNRVCSVFTHEVIDGNTKKLIVEKGMCVQ